MLSAISLDDKPLLDAGEIGNERTDRMLATEFATSEPPCAQEIPEQPFRICHVTAQVAGHRVRHMAI
jgi:hypothetical protein